MPLLPGGGAHRELLIQLKLTALDEAEGNVNRHHLGQRSWRHPQVRLFLVEYGARVHVLKEGHLRRGIERRNSGERGRGEACEAQGQDGKLDGLHGNWVPFGSCGRGSSVTAAP